jgi:hypothetical protein
VFILAPMRALRAAKYQANQQRSERTLHSGAGYPDGGLIFHA